MKEVTIKCYELHELSPEVREKVIEQHRDILVDNDSWHDPILEGFVEDMKSIGISDAKPSYSGFWSQGDGACFTASEIDLAKVFQSMRESNYFNILDSWIAEAVSGALTLTIEKKDASYAHHYHHSNTIEAVVDYVGEVFDNREWEAIEAVLTAWAQDTSNKLYKDLEAYYDEQTRGEEVAEEIESLGYLFNEDGVKVNNLLTH